VSTQASRALQIIQGVSDRGQAWTASRAAASWNARGLIRDRLGRADHGYGVSEGRRATQRVGQVFVFSATATLNPTLLAAVTLMLTLPNPERLLLGICWGRR